MSSGMTMKNDCCPDCLFEYPDLGVAPSSDRGWLYHHIEQDLTWLLKNPDGCLVCQVHTLFTLAMSMLAVATGDRERLEALWLRFADDHAARVEAFC